MLVYSTVTDHLISVRQSSTSNDICGLVSNPVFLLRKLWLIVYYQTPKIGHIHACILPAARLLRDSEYFSLICQTDTEPAHLRDTLNRHSRLHTRDEGERARSRTRRRTKSLSEMSALSASTQSISLPSPQIVSVPETDQELTIVGSPSEASPPALADELIGEHHPRGQSFNPVCQHFSTSVPASTQTSYSPLPCLPENYLNTHTEPLFGSFSPLANGLSQSPAALDCRRASLTATTISANSPISDDGSNVSESLASSVFSATPSLSSSFTSSAASSISSRSPYPYFTSQLPNFAVPPNQMLHGSHQMTFGTRKAIGGNLIPLGQDPQMISLLAAADISPSLFAWTAESQAMSPSSLCAPPTDSFLPMHLPQARHAALPSDNKTYSSIPKSFTQQDHGLNNSFGLTGFPSYNNFASAISQQPPYPMSAPPTYCTSWTATTPTDFINSAYI